jgi:hypothetical protein
MVDSSYLNPIEIAIALWEIGLVSDNAIVDWADNRILALERPSADLIELSASGIKSCLSRNSIESRSIKLTFVEQFSLKAPLLDLTCDRSAEDFIDWVSRNCWGEEIEHPALSLSYQLDHLYCDCDDLSMAIELLRSELPALLPNCREIASIFLARVPDLKLDLRSQYMPDLNRHQIRSAADVRQMLDYIETDLIPLMLDGFVRKPSSMLGGSLGELLNAINCSIVLQCPGATVQRYLNLFHVVAMSHFRFGDGSAPFAAQIDGKMFYFSPEAHSERMGVDTWADTVHACAIVGDTEGINWLCTLTEDVFTDSDGTHAPFDLAYYRYWVDFSSGGNNGSELLHCAIETADTGGRQQFINSIRHPELRLLQAILEGDEANFNRQLISALAAHKQFWSQPSHTFFPKGWISLPLLAVCTIARDRQNFAFAKRATKAVEITSDYLPQQLLNIDRG